MNRKILIALTALSLSAAVGGTFAAPSYAATTAPSTFVAFQGPETASCSTVWTWNGTPTESSFDASPGFLPANCVAMAPGTSPSEVALANGDVVVAFQGRNGDLWTWEGVPGNVGTAVDHDLGMRQGTSPSITVLSDGDAAVAFQANTDALWTWAGSPSTLGVGAPTRVDMAPDTSPSIIPQTDAAAVAVNDGTLWIWGGYPGTTLTTGPAYSTGLGMAGGTSPSITSISSGAAVAFQANDGTLWTWTGTPYEGIGVGANTDVPMAAGTSPSIEPGPMSTQPDGVNVAFQGSDGNLVTWLGTAGGDSIIYASSGLGMAAGTSPSITLLPNGYSAVAFQANNGELWTWAGLPGMVGLGASSGCASSCSGLSVTNGTSPSIAAAIPAPHGLSLTAKGNLLAKLLKPRTLVLLVYSTPKPPAHRKLLGEVALGQHPAGLSRITWGLRVHGHRLGAGDYLAELEARIDGLLTTGGPTVRFDVGQSGKLTILAQSCSARAGATVC